MEKLLKKRHISFSKVLTGILAPLLWLNEPSQAGSPQALVDQIQQPHVNAVEDEHTVNESNAAPDRSVANKGELVNSPPPSNKLNAVTLGYGRFGTGQYTPYQPVNTSSGTSMNWESCSALTLCTSDGLYGNIFSLSYTRRLYNSKTSKVDIDFQAAYANQTGTRFSRGIQVLTGGQSESFGLLSVVPTYRLRLPKPLHSISVGAGAGVNIATNTVPAEKPYDIPVNTQVNLEVALSPLKDKSVELIFSLQHRCSFFGVLNNVDGRLTGTQWWSSGIRKWF